MDDLILRRLERLNERFSGVYLRLEVLEGEPRWFGPKSEEFDANERVLRVRFKQKWGLAQRLEEVVPLLFTYGIEEKRFEILETNFGDPPPHRVDVTLQASLLAGVMAVLGTEWEESVLPELTEYEGVPGPHRMAGATLLAAGVFGWRPFIEVDRKNLGSVRSVAEPEVRAVLERIVEEVC